MLGRRRLPGLGRRRRGRRRGMQLGEGPRFDGSALEVRSRRLGCEQAQRQVPQRQRHASQRRDPGLRRPAPGRAVVGLCQHHSGRDRGRRIGWAPLQGVVRGGRDPQRGAERARLVARLRRRGPGERSLGLVRRQVFEHDRRGVRAGDAHVERVGRGLRSGRALGERRPPPARVGRGHLVEPRLQRLVRRDELCSGVLVA
mmetsp:Transcript_72571/g.203760  ORF Transcript_72571/g.203760 Transcript_72571/m.203760 type:complete len:200 (+) Transcript_72571:314-913(+)